MTGPIDIGAYVIVVLFSLVFMVFRKSLKYKERPLVLLFFMFVLTAMLISKLFCCPNLYRNFALQRFFPYLDHAAGFAAGPTFLLYVLTAVRKKHRFYFLHYTFSAAAFLFFVLYAASPEAVQEARISSIINRQDSAYQLFNSVLLVQFTAYFLPGMWLSRQPRWLCFAAAAGYILFFPAAGTIYIWFYELHHFFFIFALMAAVVFITAGSIRRFLPAGPAVAAPSAGETLEDAAEKLLDYVRSQKPYLDRDLTMTDLAGSMGLSRHRLSRVINAYFSKSYSEFISELRVEEAMEKLEHDAEENITLEYLGYTCGFNSKSSFFTHFKEYTGMTPAEYVKNVQGDRDNRGAGPDEGTRGRGVRGKSRLEKRNGRRGDGGKSKLLLFLFVLCAAVIVTAQAGCRKVPSEIIVRRMYRHSADAVEAGAVPGKLHSYEVPGLPVVLEQLGYAKNYLYWGIFLYFFLSMLRRIVIQKEHF